MIAPKPSGIILSCAALAAAIAGCNGSSSSTAPPPSAKELASAAPPSSAEAKPHAQAKAPAAREGSTIARAPTNDALFIADEDHDSLRAIALPLDSKPNIEEVKAAGTPAQVIATADRVIVSIRSTEKGEGALAIYPRKGATGLGTPVTVPLPYDAWGIALDSDEHFALVTSAWTHQLTAVDLQAAKVVWSVDVAREPRGVAILSGDRAYVTHLIGSSITRIDGLHGASPKVTRVELPAAPIQSPRNVKLPASLGYSVAKSPSGDRLYFPRHALGALGGDAWFGVSTVDVLVTADDSPLAPARVEGLPNTFIEPVSEIMHGQPWLPGALPVMERQNDVAEPRAVAYRERTRTLLVASEGTNALVEMDAYAMNPALAERHVYQLERKRDKNLGIAERGGAPSGIALSEDEDEAYVFCRSTYDLVAVKLAPEGYGFRIAPSRSIPIADDPAKKDIAVGRRIFYDAKNQSLSGGVACAGCHPEGRDDGHVWHEVTFQFQGGNKFTNFFGGGDVSAVSTRWQDIQIDVESEAPGGAGFPRQTPMLAGRVKANGPYGWHGESADLPARLQAGFGLHRWRVADNTVIDRALSGYLTSFLREGLVPPKRSERALTEEEERGKTIFTSAAAQCSRCHVPESEYTDRSVVPLGAGVKPAGFAAEKNNAFKTPSLRYVGGTAPYFHDGRYESLEELVEKNQDRMGKTAQLSAEEKKALVAFLRTL